LRSRPLALALGAVIVSVALGACGGGSEPASDDAAAEQAVEEAALGYGTAEGPDSCEFFSQSALEQLGGASGCEEAFSSAPSVAFELQTVEVDGDTGTARVRNPESMQVIDLEMINEEGDWKVAQDPSITGSAPPAE